jgi:drug/metabolite transporter (DMT)-like permease
MGGSAILLWSLSSACIYYVGRQLGVWQFLALTAGIAGLVQLAVYLAMGRRLRHLLLPPARLWLAIGLGFVLYEFLYTWALVASRTPTQTMGASLMNYLWPTLTVVFSVWWVAGERLHGRLVLSMLLSLVGLLLVNGRALARPEPGISALPYVLGGLAAVCWAAYCALTSRWRAWAQDYAASPVGFLLVSLAAAVVCRVQHAWLPMDARAWLGVVFTALGPWAAGYLLWELALHRAPGTVLGLLASATPVLSTVCLMLLFVFVGTGELPEEAPRAVYTVPLLASLLIAAAVALGRTPPPPED